MEITEDEGPEHEKAFFELITLLFKDSNQIRVLMDQVEVGPEEALDNSWWQLYEYLLASGQAYHVDWKCD